MPVRSDEPTAIATRSEESISFRPLAELLTDRLSVAALAVDSDGRIELWNRAAELLLTTPAETLGGAPLAEVLPSDPDFARALAASRDGACGTVELAMVESEPPFQVSLLPVAGGMGGTLLLFTPQRAVERWGEASEPGSDATATTQRLAALGRLSAGMAHEIRNPLAGIGTNAQVLRRRLEPADPRLRFVDFILEEVTRLDKLIEDLLRFARPPEPRLVAHDIRLAVDRALALAKSRIEQARIHTAVDADRDLPLAFVDPDQIAQVLLNLVLNAVQAMPEGGALRLAVRSAERLGPVIGRMGRRVGDDRAVSSGAQRRRFIEIEVRDTGIGIDRTDLPKLFEPFFTTRPSGTGLGLSTSQALVRQHGGAISIESERGKGTVVTVLIPVEKRRVPR